MEQMEQDSNNFQNDKIRLAREFIGLSQQAIASQIGSTQCILSILESKGRKQISIAYLTFLVEKRVDLNLLFDRNVSPTEFFSRLNISLEKYNTEQSLREQSLLEQINDLQKVIISLQRD